MKLPDIKTDISHLVSILSRVEHFRHLSLLEIKEIITAGKIRRYAKGTIIFIEDEPSAGLFVLLAGEVQICKHSSDGQISILAMYAPVIMFNEVSALDDGPNPATAMAVEDSIIWQMKGVDMQSLILKHSQIGLGLLRVLSARNRLLVAHFQDLSFRTVLARTAKILCELSNQGQTPIDRHKHTNNQMAAQIATVPEAFSRSLKLLRDMGAITCSEKVIQVIDTEKLSQAAMITPFEIKGG